MKNLIHKLSYGLIACAIFLAPASAFGWDEQGAPVQGQKYGFGDLEVKTESCIPVKENGIWGFLNDKGKVTIKPTYEEIGEPQQYKAISALGDKELNRAAIPVKKNGKWGFVGQNGKEMVKPKYDKVGVFTSTPTTDVLGKRKYETICLVMEGSNALLIDTKGKVVKALGGGLTSVFETPYGMVGVRNGKAELISGDASNTVITTYPEYIVISGYGSKMAYTPNGEPLYQVAISNYSNYNVLSKSSPGFLIIADNDLKPLNGKIYKSMLSTDDYTVMITPDNISDIYETSNWQQLGSTDKYVVKITDKYMCVAPDSTSRLYGLTTHEGREILKTEYNDIVPSGDNFIVSKDGNSALLSASGSEILPFKYKSITATGDNNYLIKGNDGIAVFNASQNKMVVPFGTFSDIGKKILKGDAVLIKKGDKWGVATSDLSRQIVAPVYDDKELSEGFTTSGSTNKYTIHIKKNGTVGVVNYAGKTIIPVDRYTGIKGYDLGVICVRKGNKVGLVDQETGRQIIAPIHDEIFASGKGHILTLDNTPNGGVAYVYDKKTGALLKKQAFTTSQKYSLGSFMRDWLGYPVEYDFTY
ncbi:MAG: WG repeat-containing protein [Bacteroidales bacterium]|nr:WG repeat-containing protein [Bacteroidales bacterium]